MIVITQVVQNAMKEASVVSFQINVNKNIII